MVEEYEPTPEELEEEREFRYESLHANLSEHARDVAKLLDTLAKTSRAFRFYAPNNKALRIFLDELFERFEAYFETFEEMELQIRPDGFLWGDAREEVFHDEDREQGFPFRLYRDGVRVLILRRGLGHDEIRNLLDVLGTKTFGRLKEEDLATLLWSARSDHMGFRKVRGFVDATRSVTRRTMWQGGAPGSFAFRELETIEASGAEQAEFAAASQQMHGRWYDEWTPPPHGDAPQQPPMFVEFTEEQLDTYRSGLAFQPATVLSHLLTRMIDTSTSGHELAPGPEKLRTLLDDARDAMLIGGDVAAYVQVLRFVRELLVALPPGDPWREGLAQHLLEGGDDTTVRLMLGAVGRGTCEPAAVLPALRVMRLAELPWLIEALDECPTADGRGAIADALVEFLGHDIERCARMAREAEGDSLDAWIEALMRANPELAMPILLELFPTAETRIQVRILTESLARSSTDGLAKLARRALAAEADEVLMLGLGAASRANHERLAKRITPLLEPGRLVALARETAVEALRVYVQLAGDEALAWLLRQAQPTRLSSDGSTREELRCRYALALGAVGTPRAEARLRELEGRGSKAFQDAVQKSLRRIRKERRS